MLNLPPASEFPPKATARMASIMMNPSRLTLSWRPALLTTMKPATAPGHDQVRKMTTGLIPFSRAASVNPHRLHIEPEIAGRQDHGHETMKTAVRMIGVWIGTPV